MKPEVGYRNSSFTPIISVGSESANAADCGDLDYLVNQFLIQKQKRVQILQLPPKSAPFEGSGLDTHPADH